MLLDILGGGVLFVYTSTEKIEAELSYKLVREFTDEDGEWLHPFSFEEHMGRLERARTFVVRNRRRARAGLMLVGAGFLLQGVALWL